MGVEWLSPTLEALRHPKSEFLHNLDIIYYPRKTQGLKPSRFNSTYAALRRASLAQDRLLRAALPRLRIRLRALAKPLHLNSDDLANHEIAHRLQGEASDQENVADGIGKQGAHEAGVQGHHHDHDNWRHAHQQAHGQAALRGVDADLTLDLEAFADHVRQVVENFSEVATSFALQHDGGDEKFNVDGGHALGEIHERVAHGHAKFLLFEKLAKFAGDRLGDFR